MDEETLVYLCGRQREHVVWYQFVLESSTVLSKGEKRDREGHTIEGTTSSPIALIHADKFGRGGCWAVIGDDIYYAGGRSREDQEVTTDKDLIKHNIHHNDSSSWETVTSLTIPRTGSFLAPVGRKLAIVSSTTMPLHPRPTPEVRLDNWRNCGEIYDLDTQSLDYLTSPMHYFDPYQSFPFSNSTTVLEDPKQVVFYNLEKGTLLILDASNGVIIENKTTPDPCFALWAESFMEDPPQGLRGCEESIALLRIAVSNSRAVFHRRTFYQFTYELMLYGYDVDQHKWFGSECLQHILKLPVHKITFPPLLIGLPNENLLVILFSKKVKPIMASLSVEKKLGSTTLDVNVKHIQHFHPQPFFFPCYGGIAMSSKCEEVAELTWEKGQLGMHGLGGILSISQAKQTLGRTGDTLESIVHQATCHGKNQTSIHQNYGQNDDQDLNIGELCSGRKWGESSQEMAPPRTTVLAKKRMRPSESDPQYGGAEDHEYAERSACARASATFCKENDTTMVTWPSFDESSRSIKSKTTCDEDSACHGGGSENKEEEHETKRSNSSRRSRAAAVHNQSERRRRDRINQRLKALQRLVPNASKTDKASMLDEVIDYLKQLQAQVQLMSSTPRNIASQMMMPLGMHQHIQMSLLARMGVGVGLGMGMGMFDMTTLARAAAASATTPHQSLTTHPLIHPNQMTATTNNIPFIPPGAFAPAFIPSATLANTVARANTVSPDAYKAFLPQSMDMEYFNNMAALYRQQLANQSTQITGSKLNQGDQTDHRN